MTESEFIEMHRDIAAIRGIVIVTATDVAWIKEAMRARAGAAKDHEVRISRLERWRSALAAALATITAIGGYLMR